MPTRFRGIVPKWRIWLVPRLTLGGSNQSPVELGKFLGLDRAPRSVIRVRHDLAALSLDDGPLCPRGTTDRGVNDILGRPFFAVRRPFCVSWFLVLALVGENRGTGHSGHKQSLESKGPSGRPEGRCLPGDGVWPVTKTCSGNTSEVVEATRSHRATLDEATLETKDNRSWHSAG